mgnify:CR=1 FL=1
MITRLLRVGLWGGIVSSIVGPCYGTYAMVQKFNQVVDDTGRHVQAQLNVAVQQYARERFKGFFDEQLVRASGERKAVREFRHTLKTKLGFDCGTSDEMPVIQRKGRDQYELTMECQGKTMVIPFSRKSVCLRDYH